ncbi:diguanylate cyclase [Bacillus sp. EB01]|uniref:diguanylate cyclase n=1 Tax=Bacillus sp. EB01 TaxID=1347086 RepID=UPI0005C5D8CC|nr:diguanylate cyclase [Bacillus sp. EB01]
MDTKKYAKLIFEKVKNQVVDWFDVREVNLPDDDELFRFLHSIKGTAGTVGLTSLADMADTMLEDVKEGGKKQWKREQLRDFLFNLISYVYEQENISDKKGNSIGESLPIIQIISEDISEIVLLKESLEKQGWMVMGYTSYEQAIDSPFNFKPDCMVIEISGKSGLSVLDELKNNGGKQYIPKLIVSSFNNVETRIEAFRKGADDFLEFPYDLEELQVRIERQLERKRLFDESALLDELTGLYNRRFLKDTFLRKINSLSRTKKGFCLAILDLDYFKKINDRFGHPIGDKVLLGFAGYIKDSIRGTDSAFRIGGEEFALILPDTDIEEAQLLVEQLLEGLSSYGINQSGQSISISFSAGVTVINKEITSLEEAFAAADQALYRAKEMGRSRIEPAIQEGSEVYKKTLFVSIIDDDAIIRSLLAKVLERMDAANFQLDIKLFEDGRKFFEVDRLHAEGEHFIILDGIMPVMDGIEVLQKVRKESGGRPVKVLMLTGRKNEYDIARALSLGADDYVTKPFSITELEARIKVLIQRQY